MCVNCQFSVFPCWSRKWTETWSTGIPVSPYAPFSLTQDPTVMGEAIMRVCAFMHDINFLFYRGNGGHTYISFTFSLWEKTGQKKKDNSHESVWETTIIVSGKRSALNAHLASLKSNFEKYITSLFQPLEKKKKTLKLSSKNSPFFFLN